MRGVGGYISLQVSAIVGDPSIQFQPGSIKHLESHPSPFKRLPSSHSLEKVRRLKPSPHISTHPGKLGSGAFFIPGI